MFVYINEVIANVSVTLLSVILIVITLLLSIRFSHPHLHSMATHHNNMPFLLERKDVELVKPAKPTPFEVLSFSSIDNDRNLELLCQSIYVYQAKPILSNGNAHHI